MLDGTKEARVRDNRAVQYVCRHHVMETSGLLRAYLILGPNTQEYQRSA